MKKTGSKLTAYLLCAVLLVAAFAPQILAANGPLQTKPYEAFLRLTKLNEKGEALNTDEFGNEISDSLFENNEATPGIEGAVYDMATNTLTLTNFDGAYTWLTANAMGDDFTIVVNGNCALNGVTVWGWMHGSGLHIEGDGTLTVNGNKKAECAINFIAEDTTPLLSLGEKVNVNLYGTDCVVFAKEAVTTDPPSLIKTAKGQTFEVKAEKVTVEENPYLVGYSNPMEMSVWTADCATDTDKNHKYALESGTRHWSTGLEEDFVEVSRYIYVEKYDVYLKDYAWAESQGGDFGKVSFESLEAAEKAGYTKRLDEHGNKIFEKTNYCGSYGVAYLYEDDKGNQYVVESVFEGTERVEYAATIEPLDGFEETYIFIIDKSVDVSKLTQLPSEIIVFDDMFDIVVPQKELIYKGGQAPARLLGDVDNNNKVEAADARLALRAAVGLENYAAGSAEFVAADVDKSQAIEAGDARLILRAAVGLETLG